MTPIQKIQNAFQLVALLHRMQAVATDMAQLIEQPGFDEDARTVIDALLGEKPGGFALACGMAVGEVRGPADKLASDIEMAASLIPAASTAIGARGTDWAEMIATPILSVEQAKAFIRYLHKADLMFHFEDSIDSIVQGAGEGFARTFTDAEVGPLSARVAELYSFQWGAHECPIGYALDFERGGPAWRKE